MNLAQTETMIQMEVIIYATYPYNKPTPSHKCIIMNAELAKPIYVVPTEGYGLSSD
jgi:hypothetical protein